MAQRLKTALVGCGKVASFHADAYFGLENSAFTAVCDNSLERADTFARQYGVKAYDSITEMVEKEKIDVVSICTPHPMHAAAAVPAIKAGASVIIEKPLADTLENCDFILNSAKEMGVKVGAVVQRRLYRSSMRIKKAIDGGKIGRPVLGKLVMHGWRDKAYYESDAWRGTWKGEGGGVLVNQAPHQIDLLSWYMGEPEEVYGVWSNVNHPYIEVDDTALAIVKFKGGGMANIFVSNSQNPALYGKVHIFGENGASVGVQTDSGAMFIAGMSEITEYPYNDVWTVLGEEDMPAQWRREDDEFYSTIDFMKYHHRLQLEDFINSLITGAEPLVDGYDGRRTIEIIQAIYKSTETGAPVKLPII